MAESENSFAHTFSQMMFAKPLDATSPVTCTIRSPAAPINSRHWALVRSNYIHQDPYR